MNECIKSKHHDDGNYMHPYCTFEKQNVKNKYLPMTTSVFSFGWKTIKYKIFSRRQIPETFAKFCFGSFICKEF